MKIAVITEDENSVSQHFGRAPWYEVFTVEDGKITGREKRAKMGHQHFAGQGGAHHEQAGAQHGFDEVSHGRHAGMASAIQDCSVLIAGGMGMGAFASLQSFNIQAVITDETDARKAVERYVAGSLPNLKDRLH